MNLKGMQGLLPNAEVMSGGEVVVFWTAGF